MKAYLATFIAGSVFSFLVCYKYYSAVAPQVVTKEVVRTDVVTVIKRVKEPNGTVTTEITKKDNSVSEQAKAPLVLAPKYYITLNKTNSIYTLTASKQFIGPISLGLSLNSEKAVGVTVGVQF